MSNTTSNGQTQYKTRTNEYVLNTTSNAQTHLHQYKTRTNESVSNTTSRVPTHPHQYNRNTYDAITCHEPGNVTITRDRSRDPDNVTITRDRPPNDALFEGYAKSECCALGQTSRGNGVPIYLNSVPKCSLDLPKDVEQTSNEKQSKSGDRIDERFTTNMVEGKSVSQHKRYIEHENSLSFSKQRIPNSVKCWRTASSYSLPKMNVFDDYLFHNIVKKSQSLVDKKLVRPLQFRSIRRTYSALGRLSQIRIKCIRPKRNRLSRISAYDLSKSSESADSNYNRNSNDKYVPSVFSESYTQGVHNTDCTPNNIPVDNHFNTLGSVDNELPHVVSGKINNKDILSLENIPSPNSPMNANTRCSESTEDETYDGFGLTNEKRKALLNQLHGFQVGFPSNSLVSNVISKPEDEFQLIDGSKGMSETFIGSGVSSRNKSTDKQDLDDKNDKTINKLSICAQTTQTTLIADEAIDNDYRFESFQIKENDKELIGSINELNQYLSEELAGNIKASKKVETNLLENTLDLTKVHEELYTNSIHQHNVHEDELTSSMILDTIEPSNKSDMKFKSSIYYCVDEFRHSNVGDILSNISKDTNSLSIEMPIGDFNAESLDKLTQKQSLEFTPRVNSICIGHNDLYECPPTYNRSKHHYTATYVDIKESFSETIDDVPSDETHLHDMDLQTLLDALYDDSQRETELSAQEDEKICVPKVEGSGLNYGYVGAKNNFQVCKGPSI